MEFLNREYQILKLGNKIQSKVNETFTKSQRDIFLREQLRTIQKELNEADPQLNEILELEKRLEEAKLPKQARDAAAKELQRLKNLLGKGQDIAPPKENVTALKSNGYQQFFESIRADKRTMDRLEELLAEDLKFFEKYLLTNQEIELKDLKYNGVEFRHK